MEDRSFRVCAFRADLEVVADVCAAAKTSDLILIMLDATKSGEQRRLLEHELDAVGIRLNRNKPDIVFKRRTTGGFVFVSPAMSL